MTQGQFEELKRDEENEIRMFDERFDALSSVIPDDPKYDAKREQAKRSYENLGRDFKLPKVADIKLGLDSGDNIQLLELWKNYRNDEGILGVKGLPSIPLDEKNSKLLKQ